jgi:tryptophan synthase beta chain
MKYWIANPASYYVFGTACGPAPFPEMVTYFQQIIGQETKKQILEIENKLPNVIVAAIGGGSNAIGIFSDFINEDEVKLIGVEPAGDGKNNHGMSIQKGRIGCLHGSIQNLLCDANGNISESHSVSAGLDYPGVSPIHSHLNQLKRAEYVGITDSEAVNAYKEFSKLEGILPALESSHAIAHVMKIAKNYQKDQVIIFNLSGRGDKDIDTINNFIE